MNFNNRLAVICEGKSGGLALLWESNVDVSDQNFSQNHIYVVIPITDDNARLSGTSQVSMDTRVQIIGRTYGNVFHLYVDMMEGLGWCGR